MRTRDKAEIVVLFALFVACDFGFIPGLGLTPTFDQSVPEIFSGTFEVMPKMDGGVDASPPPPPQDEGEQPPEHCNPDSGRPYIHLCR